MALKTILLQSTGAMPGGMPSMAILPPITRLATIWSSACGLPDISMPTSKPSAIFRRIWTSLRSSCATLTGVTSATRAARSSRVWLTSVITTCRAPTWRATAAAMMPMGPAPVISTSSPTRSKLSAVCTALPKGSRIAPMSSDIPSGKGTTLKAGRRRYCPKAPFSFTPMPRVAGSR